MAGSSLSRMGICSDALPEKSVADTGMISVLQKTEDGESREQVS
jgi:hypothetical protein